MLPVHCLLLQVDPVAHSAFQVQTFGIQVPDTQISLLMQPLLVVHALTEMQIGRHVVIFS